MDDGYKVEGVRFRNRPKKACREVVGKDFQKRQLNKDDAVDCSKLRKDIVKYPQKIGYE